MVSLTYSWAEEGLVYTTLVALIVRMVEYAQVVTAMLLSSREIFQLGRPMVTVMVAECVRLTSALN